MAVSFRLPVVPALGAVASACLAAVGLVVLVRPGMIGVEPSAGLGAGLLVLGVGLLFATSRLARFEPTTRFPPRTLVVYRRRQCAACDEAKALLLRLLGGTGVAVEEVDVDASGNEAARKAYTDWVPVALYEGREVFRLAVDEARLREAIEG